MTEPVSPRTARIGWIGIGVMGAPMCGHVLAAGYEVSVFARRPEGAVALRERGAEILDSPAAVAERSDVVVTIVAMPADVRAVTLGSDGTLAAAPEGSVLVDMTTSEPSLAQEIHSAAAEQGVEAVDAPVSGGDVGAREARLSIMVGGTAEAVERVRPLLEVLGQAVVRQGGPGAGQHTKVANQILIASTMVGVCEGLLYAHRAGLDPTTVLGSIGSGAAASAALTNLAPRMIAGDYAPGFYVEHFCKDLGIALDEARRMQLAVPGLALADQLYRALRAQGHARSGTQALITALAGLSHVDWP